MAHYTAEVLWSRDGQNFLDNRYSRKHLLRFDCGIEVAGSSSPHVVPLPYSAVDAVDPEEAFVAALSSCHMLWFLSLAARQGYVVDRYHDRAEGIMERDAKGKLAITVVTLHPQVIFGSEPPPDAAQADALHHQAHESCFIANSVKTEVRIAPRNG